MVRYLYALISRLNCEDIRFYGEMRDVPYGNSLRMIAFETTLACTLTDLPICSPWTFRENHSPNIIYTVNRRNQPTAMDLYFLDWVRTRYKTEPETHTKSAHTEL